MVKKQPKTPKRNITFALTVSKNVNEIIMPTLTKKKAKKILKHGSVKGHKLTKKQIGFFGARTGGSPVKKRRVKK